MQRGTNLMRILHFNAYDFGGAANGAFRVHASLLEQDVTSFFASSTKSDDDASKILVSHNNSRMPQFLINKASSFILHRVYKKNDRAFYSASLFPNSVNDIIKEVSPDIIHFHWIAAGFISYFAMRHIASLKIPVVWTIRDTWAFTGGCHFFGDCNKWKTRCENCPCLDRQFVYDLALQQWKKKLHAYSQCQPHIVALSKQFSEHIDNAPLLKNFLRSHIPNPIDTQRFYPIDPLVARRLLGLEQHKKYILFGAISSTVDRRKGFDLLTEALGRLNSPDADINCLVFGASHAGGSSLPLPVRFLGQVHDALCLSLVYSAADVFVCPSREESFSNTTLESLACGNPVVGFAVGGIPDMVEHKVNGMLATPHDPRELAEGIAYVLEDAERREAMGRAARRTVEEKYAYPVVAKQYISLYEQLLATR